MSKVVQFPKQPPVQSKTADQRVVEDLLREIGRKLWGIEYDENGNTKEGACSRQQR